LDLFDWNQASLNPATQAHLSSPQKYVMLWGWMNLHILLKASTIEGFCAPRRIDSEFVWAHANCFEERTLKIGNLSLISRRVEKILNANSDQCDLIIGLKRKELQDISWNSPKILDTSKMKLFICFALELHHRSIHSAFSDSTFNAIDHNAHCYQG
jgi:hypothetical protein